MSGVPDDAIAIGRVVKPHGVRGELVVMPLSDVPDRFAPDTPIWLDGSQRRIVSARQHQGRWLVGLDGVSDRSAAELLRGAELLAAPLDPEELDTYLASELVGLPVVHVDGRRLGVVQALIELPAAAGYDLLEVDGPLGTWLLPAADELCTIEDHEAGPVIVADPPDGLLDGEPEVARSDDED